MFCHLLRHLCQTARMKLQRVNQPRESPPCSQGEDTPIVRNRELLLEGEIAFAFKYYHMKGLLEWMMTIKVAWRAYLSPAVSSPFHWVPVVLQVWYSKPWQTTERGMEEQLLATSRHQLDTQQYKNNTENLCQQKHDITTETKICWASCWEL